MTLLEEFEQNVKTVVEILENCLEAVEQQFIYEDEQVDQKEDIILKTFCVKGLREEAAWDVSITTFMSFSLWGNAFREILMWLARYMPQFKSKIERQYSYIVKRLNAIPSVQHAFKDRQSRRSRQTEDRQIVELIGLKTEIRKLADDLRYCAKMAREESGTEKPAETEQKAPSMRQRIWNGVKRIPRWIYVLVIFLAALLTCIYIFWWLWTNFLI